MFKELLIDLKDILKHFENQLQVENENRDLINEKISDIKTAIEACEFEDEENALEWLCQTANDTTCNTLHELIGNYFDFIDKLAVIDTDTEEYYVCNSIEELPNCIKNYVEVDFSLRW